MSIMMITILILMIRNARAKNNDDSIKENNDINIIIMIWLTALKMVTIHDVTMILVNTITIMIKVEWNRNNSDDYVMNNDNGKC